MARPPQGDQVYPHQELSQTVIGAAFEVHRELGPGFLEKVYETALLREIRSRGIKAQSQAQIDVSYKGQPVGVYYADVLVDDKVICEIKAVAALVPVHEAQLLHYLTATGIEVGLILNFGNQRVQFKRLVRTK